MKENQKRVLAHYCNSLNLLRCRLALKVAKQDFNESMLQYAAQAIEVDVQIISKLSGMNSDRFDWYCIEVLGTFDDLYLAVVNWREVGVEQYVAISSQLLEYTI